MQGLGEEIGYMNLREATALRDHIQNEQPKSLVKVHRIRGNGEHIVLFDGHIHIWSLEDWKRKDWIGVMA